MAAYITAYEYDNLEGSADDAAFKRLELKVRKLIDAATHGRIANETPVREAAKMCAFELIEMMAAEESGIGIGGREISGTSNDGVSITYSNGSSQGMTARQKKIIRDWLADETTERGIPLLYAGVDA
jgi:hypothetical protein